MGKQNGNLLVYNETHRKLTRSCCWFTHSPKISKRNLTIIKEKFNNMNIGQGDEVEWSVSSVPVLQNVPCPWGWGGDPKLASRIVLGMSLMLLELKFSSLHSWLTSCFPFVFILKTLVFTFDLLQARLSYTRSGANFSMVIELKLLRQYNKKSYTLSHSLY